MKHPMIFFFPFQKVFPYVAKDSEILASLSFKRVESTNRKFKISEKDLCVIEHGTKRKHIYV